MLQVRLQGQHTFTLDEGFVVGMLSFPGNPIYDSHALHPALEHVEILTNQRPDLTVADRGYRGLGEDKPHALLSGTFRSQAAKWIAPPPLQRHRG